MSNTIYCTYLTTYSGDKLPPLYIGSTSVQKIKEGYRGSVSSKKYKEIWIKELKENPHLFETKILTTHSSREEALEEESRLQELHDVVNSDLYANMAIANKKYIFTDYNDPEYRNKQSETHKNRLKSKEARKRQSEIAKKTWTEERRKKQSEAMKRRYENPEERKKTSDSQKGKKKSAEHKKKVADWHRGKIRSEQAKKNMSNAWKIRKNILI